MLKHKNIKKKNYKIIFNLINNLKNKLVNSNILKDYNLDFKNYIKVNKYNLLLKDYNLDFKNYIKINKYNLLLNKRLQIFTIKNIFIKKFIKKKYIRSKKSIKLKYYKKINKIYKKKYILFITLRRNNIFLMLIKKIRKIYKLPIITSKKSSRILWTYSFRQKKYKFKKEYFSFDVWNKIVTLLYKKYKFFNLKNQYILYYISFSKNKRRLYLIPNFFYKLNRKKKLYPICVIKNYRKFSHNKGLRMPKKPRK